MSSEEWAQIRAEYEAGASLRKLALKYNIGKSTIERHAKEGQWDSGTVRRDVIPTPKKGDREREAKQAIFLDSFKQTANISESCKDADINRSTFYDWLERYEEFSIFYHQAEQIANDRLRREILRRGVEGWLEPQFSAGKNMGNVRKYSDTLLIFLAKARMPEFREKQQIDITTHPDVSGAKELLMQRLARLEGSEA
jgi:transposase